MGCRIWGSRGPNTHGITEEKGQILRRRDLIKGWRIGVDVISITSLRLWLGSPCAPTIYLSLCCKRNTLPGIENLIPSSMRWGVTGMRHVRA